MSAPASALGALLSIPRFPLWSVCVFFLNTSSCAASPPSVATSREPPDR